MRGIERVVRIVRQAGYSCNPLGAGPQHFPPGDYRVPSEMSEEVARRCLASNIGTEVQKKLETKKPARKKKRATKKRGSA